MINLDTKRNREKMEEFNKLPSDVKKVLQKDFIASLERSEKPKLVPLPKSVPLKSSRFGPYSPGYKPYSR